jgi:large subunit ribosomal protein L22
MSRFNPVTSQKLSLYKISPDKLMLVRSTTKYARISPKKARHVVREIQGLPVSDALDALKYTPKKSARLIFKTLESAIANAENNHELSADELIVKEAVVGEGPTLKRFKPRARGSAGAIRKRQSHIFITLTDEFEAPEEKKRSGKPKKRDTIKSLFGAGAKPAAKKEEAPAAKKEEAPAAKKEEAPAEVLLPRKRKLEETEATEESAE